MQFHNSIFFFVFSILVLVVAISANTEEPDCVYKGGKEDSWKRSCNWCRCAETNFAVCTRKGCPPALRDETMECKGNAEWKEDCYWCTCENGKPSCPEKRSCTEADETPTAKLTRSDESVTSLSETCTDGETWAQECNTCTCEGGETFCTEEDCSEGTPKIDANTFREHIQRLEVILNSPDFDTFMCKNGSRWKPDGCNWCSCYNNVGACTLRLCTSPEPLRSECEDGALYKEDCNVCSCANGIEICTERDCSKKPEARAELRDDIECTATADDDRWLKSCNWCRCSKDGFGMCTRKLCPPGYETRQPETETVCEGKIKWKEDCNWCHCVEGKAVCTEKFCIEPDQEPKPVMSRTAVRHMEKTCKDGSRWMQECNWCSCNNGIGICTLKACSTDAAIAMDGTCEGDSEWKKDCNLCHCVDGKGVCTTELCQEAESKPVLTKTEETCKDGSQWMQGCNWCSCSNGIGSCGLKGCLEDTAKELDGTCKGDSKWKVDCNWCHCVDGKGVCATELCQEGEENMSSSRAIDEAELECDEGSRWGTGCSWCTCENGKAKCDLQQCDPAVGASLEGKCEGESRWKKDCNWCNCASGKAICTLKACLKAPTPPQTETDGCAQGNSWREDCNVCSCVNGFGACTRMMCPPKAAVRSECADGEVRKEDCNICRCVNGGFACTRRLCPSSQVAKSISPPDVCSLPPISPDAEVCGGFEIKFTYDKVLKKCDEVVYGGCGGTENLFNSIEECQAVCGGDAETANAGDVPQNSKERCLLPVEAGPCFALLKRYAFVPEKNRCEQFFYGGCQGNQNNFETPDECFGTCGGNPPVVDPKCDRTQCNWKRYDHYIAKSCKPVYEAGSCCPTRFDCTSTKSPSLDKCVYRGQEFAVQKEVPVDEECSAACQCRESSVPGEQPEIICANVECPSLFRKPEPGCRGIYELGKCCSVDRECTNPDLPEEVELRSNDCSWNNNTFKEGDRMYFDDEPCQRCICTPEFTDPHGPGCKKINCGYDFRARSQRQLSKGCTPIFFEEKCCSIDWMCPEDKPKTEDLTREVSTTEPASPSSPSECRLGDVVIPLGGTMDGDDCHVKCSCVTPPDLTCVRYRSCELANESLTPNTDMVCPQIQCPKECSSKVDPVSGCTKCFCSDTKLACPETVCPPACVNPTIEFDQSAGCNVCKCECRKDFHGRPPCPMDCIIKIFFDENSGCDKCVCDKDSPSMVA